MTKTLIIDFPDRQKTKEKDNSFSFPLTYSIGYIKTIESSLESKIQGLTVQDHFNLWFILKLAEFCEIESVPINNTIKISLKK